MFFSHEHEPMHVHVIGNEGEAKFSWNGDRFVLEKSRNVKHNDLRRIKMLFQTILILSLKDGKNCSVNTGWIRF